MRLYRPGNNIMKVTLRLANSNLPNLYELTKVCDKVNDMLGGTGTCKDISFSLPGASLPVKNVCVCVGGCGCV